MLTTVQNTISNTGGDVGPVRLYNTA